MRRLLVFLLLASPALAGTLTITTTAAQDNRLERLRKRMNTQVCAAESLPATCTQPQLRDAYCQRTAGTPAPCTGSASLDIYKDANDMAREIIRQSLKAHAATQDAEDKQAWDAALGTATTEQKNAACAALGKPAGCLP